MAGPGSEWKQTLGARIFVTLFLSPFIILGGLLLCAMLWRIPFALLTLAYREAPCEVLQSKVLEEGEGANRVYGFWVRYRYQAGGKEHVSEVYQRGHAMSSRPGPAHKLLRDYPEGATATCYVSPVDPSKAVLARWDADLVPGTILLHLVVVLIFGGIPAGVAWIVWFGVPELRSLSSPRLTPYFGVGMGGLFFLAGSALVYFTQVGPFLHTRAARSWVEAPCRILESAVSTHVSETREKGRTRTSTSYSADVLFTYTVDGDVFRSTTYGFSASSFSKRGDAERIVRAHPPESERVCFYNPADPSEAVLDRSFRFEPIPLLFGAIFAGAGLAVARFTWTSRDRPASVRRRIPQRGPG